MRSRYICPNAVGYGIALSIQKTILKKYPGFIIQDCQIAKEK